MPAKSRAEVVDCDEVGVYHCWNRVVQRRHLLGVDLLTGQDLSHRKEWIRGRLTELAGALAVDVLDFAILDNHIHVVLQNRPDIVQRWSDAEVTRRWWFVCPGRKNADGSVPEPVPAELKLLEQYADEHRKRLSDISWLMRLLCQPIAYRANREDGVDGRFFAKRFECSRLHSVADVLACSIYVDLNPIHAGMANTPEKSAYTSAFDRIRSRWQGVHTDLSGDSCPSLADKDADADA